MISSGEKTQPGFDEHEFQREAFQRTFHYLSTYGSGESDGITRILETGSHHDVKNSLKIFVR